MVDPDKATCPKAKSLSLGFRVWGSGFRISDFGFRGLGFGVLGFWSFGMFGVLGFWGFGMFGVEGFRVCFLGLTGQTCIFSMGPSSQPYEIIEI